MGDGREGPPRGSHPTTAHTGHHGVGRWGAVRGLETVDPPAEKSQWKASNLLTRYAIRVFPPDAL